MVFDSDKLWFVVLLPTKISESSKTRVRTYWLYNENDIVKVREELINDYIVKGYKRGRGYNPFK